MLLKKSYRRFASVEKNYSFKTFRDLESDYFFRPEEYLEHNNVGDTSHTVGQHIDKLT